jgi:hypothetical protein
MSSSGNWPHRHDTVASRNWETRTAQRRRRHSSLLLLLDERAMRLAIAVGVVLLIAAGIWLWNSRQAAAGDLPEQTRVASEAPAATPTSASTPTPAVRSATIVRLGGGPGMLHEAPEFRTPVLSVILQEGDTVELLGREAQDAEGGSWVLVAFGDNVGWSPENNLEIAP